MNKLLDKFKEKALRGYYKVGMTIEQELVTDVTLLIQQSYDLGFAEGVRMATEGNTKDGFTTKTRIDGSSGELIDVVTNKPETNKEVFKPLECTYCENKDGHDSCNGYDGCKLPKSDIEIGLNKKEWTSEDWFIFNFTMLYTSLDWNPDHRSVETWNDLERRLRRIYSHPSCKPLKPPTCRWTIDEDGVYFASCNDAFYFDGAGTPEEHHFKFCPFCGLPIETKEVDHG